MTFRFYPRPLAFRLKLLWGHKPRPKFKLSHLLDCFKMEIFQKIIIHPFGRNTPGNFRISLGSVELALYKKSLLSIEAFENWLEIQIQLPGRQGRGGWCPEREMHPSFSPHT